METYKKKRLMLFLKAYLLVFSASGFTMFICEEVMQTAQFGAFAYKTADDYEGLRWHVENIMIPAHESCSFIIKAVGWVNPIMYPAYLQYIKVNEGMIIAQANLVNKKLKLIKLS